MSFSASTKGWETASEDDRRSLGQFSSENTLLWAPLAGQLQRQYLGWAGMRPLRGGSECPAQELLSLSWL